MGWVSVQAKVTNKKSDDFTKILAPISFDFFFKACNAFNIDDENISASENGSATIFLSDSTRDRKAILAYVFRPLTSDVFGEYVAYYECSQFSLIFNRSV